MEEVCFEIDQGRPLSDAFHCTKEKLLSFGQLLGYFKSQFTESLATA